MTSGRKPKIEKIAGKRPNVLGEIIEDQQLLEDLRKHREDLEELLQNWQALKELLQKELIYKRPRPELDGLRVRMPGDYRVYLIDKGYKRWIPDDETYDQLFSTRENIHLDLHLDEVPDGMDIPSGSRLVTFSDDPSIYMAEWDKEQAYWSRLRHVATQGVMDRYQFDASKIENLGGVIAGVAPVPPLGDDPDALRTEGPPG